MSAPRGQTVFVVEDDLDFRIALGDVLAEAGLHPVLFATARKLLSSLDDGVPAAIVTDFLMPGVSGAELLAALRENDRWRGIPVVVMTGTNDTALPLRLGAPVVYKPDTDGLLRTIKTVLGRSTTTRMAAESVGSRMTTVYFDCESPPSRVPRKLPAMVGSDKRKQSLYFPERMLAEISAEATRQDRSLSWIVQKAWELSRKEVMRARSSNDSIGESQQGEAVK